MAEARPQERGLPPLAGAYLPAAPLGLRWEQVYRGRILHLSSPFPIPHKPGAVSASLFYYIQTLQN